MSKERELLKKILATGWLNNELSCEVDDLLAQPKREPSASAREMYQRGYAKAELDLKREPMTDSEISHGFRADEYAINTESYWAGVELAEKHYGVEINETL